MSSAKNVSISLRNTLAGFIGKKVARQRLRTHYYEEFSRYHPNIQYDGGWRDSCIKSVHNESGLVLGHVAEVLKTLGLTPQQRVLLAGESIEAKAVYGQLLGLPLTAITVTGLDKNAEVPWNFEEAPPAMGLYNAIVSHAILEHLIDPYRHVCDLVRLLAPGGYLVMYTVIPGFPYHRYPVDCLRFFPDWFVEVAKRNQVTIHDQYIGEDHLVFTFKKPA